MTNKRSKIWLGRAMASFESANDCHLQAKKEYEMIKAQTAALIAIAYELVVEEEDAPVEPELKTEYKDPIWDKAVKGDSKQSDKPK